MSNKSSLMFQLIGHDSGILYAFETSAPSLSGASRACVESGTLYQVREEGKSESRESAAGKRSSFPSRSLESAQSSSRLAVSRFQSCVVLADLRFDIFHSLTSCLLSSFRLDLFRFEATSTRRCRLSSPESFLRLMSSEAA